MITKRRDLNDETGTPSFTERTWIFFAFGLLFANSAMYANLLSMTMYNAVTVIVTVM